MTDAGFAHEDHTADLMVRAWGPTLEEAFAQAARGLVAYMVELRTARATVRRAIEVEGEDAALLLCRFLEEVRFLLETESLVLHRFRVTLAPGRLRAEAEGEPHDAARHGHVHEIKAVTLHGARVVPSPPEVRYVVDI